ncbi:TIGR01777 family oxidoreductase [Ornithinicoccus halotolerans]|uniref:TIGR01777 family oxidoreductase n=1 Tax=Ornithinicoccus halotolerans TaxID=1748220 RepID=UPI0012949F3A|nr:TIGR01777 family oxidoreductase [Ornithinicoccus halotolerans]
MTPPRRTVAITGASGLIGSALSTALRERGDRVLHLVRRAPRAVEELPDGVQEADWEPEEARLDPAVLEGVDAVVHLAGAGVADRRWTDSYRATLRRSRIEGTRAVAAAVAEHGGGIRLLSASRVSYYGERGADVLTEDSGHGTGFLAELCRDWEAATWRAQQAGAPVAHLRSGIVLSRDGGAMGRLLPLARFGLGGPLGSGRQYWSWITLHDHVRAVLFLLEQRQLTGAVNVTGPSPAPQAEVVKELGEQLRRPARVPAPTIALRLALGEMATEILGSQRALPTVLQDAGFSFDHPHLEAAVRWLVGTEPVAPGPVPR